MAQPHLTTPLILSNFRAKVEREEQAFTPTASGATWGRGIPGAPAPWLLQ